MANTRKIPRDIDLAERAAFYGVSERSCRRWHNSGANLRDPESVGDLLLKQRVPKAITLKKLTTSTL